MPIPRNETDSLPSWTPSPTPAGDLRDEAGFDIDAAAATFRKRLAH